MSDSTPRLQHDRFVHGKLRVAFFSGPERIVDLLDTDGAKFLRFLWDRVADDLEGKGELGAAERPRHLVPSDGLDCEVLRYEDGTAIAFITLPTPCAMTEAYFVAAIHRPDGSRFLTLECNSTVPVGALLCEWGDGGSHAILRAGPEPEIEPFRQAVVDLLGVDRPPGRAGGGSREEASRDRASDLADLSVVEGGSGRTREEAREDRSAMQCRKCGKEWPGAAKFCGVCGGKLDPAPSERKIDPEATVPVKTPARPGRPSKQGAPRVGQGRVRPEIRLSQEKPPERFADKIRSLAERAGLIVQSRGPDIMEAVFAVKGGRTQRLLFRYAGELAGKPVVKITSPVADLRKHPIAGEAALELLATAGKFKLGGFSIDGNHLVVQQGLILSDLTPGELRDTASTLALIADDAEKSLTGGDTY